MSIVQQVREEDGGLPAVLALAQSERLPGEPLPPGPRANPWRPSGAVADAPSRGVHELVEALWHPGDFHRTQGGSPTGIRRRPVPSAGACYPVTTHLVDAAGVRWAVDQEGTFHRRDPLADRAAGWPAPAAEIGVTRLVFAALPGRSFGRYRHRAWPLWIADAAYAVAAVRLLLGAQVGRVDVGPSAQLRSLLAVPRATDSDAWLRRGLAPEIPLASMQIPAEPRVDARARRALATRRSPSLQEFSDRVGDRPADEAERLARAAGQAWVRGASAVSSWSVQATASPTVVGAALWDAHLAAARLCYDAVLTGDRRARPVSGFASAGGQWILHAVAFLDSSGGSR